MAKMQELELEVVFWNRGALEHLNHIGHAAEEIHQHAPHLEEPQEILDSLAFVIDSIAVQEEGGASTLTDATIIGLQRQRSFWFYSAVVGWSVSLWFIGLVGLLVWYSK